MFWLNHKLLLFQDQRLFALSSICIWVYNYSYWFFKAQEIKKIDFGNLYPCWYVLLATCVCLKWATCTVKIANDTLKEYISTLFANRYQYQLQIFQLICQNQTLYRNIIWTQAVTKTMVKHKYNQPPWLKFKRRIDKY